MDPGALPLARYGSVIFFEAHGLMDHIWAEVYQIRDGALQTPGLILEPPKAKRTP